MNGISFMIVLGKSGGLRFERSKHILRIVLGPVAFWILFFDFERILGQIKEANEKVIIK